MEKQLITVGSVTYAMKGKEILLRHGIRAFVEKTPKRAGNSGCGYGISVAGDIQRAAAILTQNGIRVTAISDGVAEQ